MDPLASHVAKVLAKEIDHALEVETAVVVTAAWVPLKCRFGCDRYGGSFCCPPRTPDDEQMRRVLDSYRRAVLLHRRWPEGVLDVTPFNDVVVDLELSLFWDGYYKALGLGSGPCKRCRSCDPGGRCVQAARARPSMEACGIDVFATARASGLPLHVLTSREDRRDSFGLVLVD